MTVAMQRWLAIRLDFFANVLVLGIALFGVSFRQTINPAKFSVVLTYTLSGKSMQLLLLILAKYYHSNSDVLYASASWIYMLFADLS
jgi:hypothetical protein